MTVDRGGAGRGRAPPPEADAGAAGYAGPRNRRDPPSQVPGITPLVPAPLPAPVRVSATRRSGTYARCGYRFYLERVLGLPPRPSHDAEVPAGDEPRLRQRRRARDDRARAAGAARLPPPGVAGPSGRRPPPRGSAVAPTAEAGGRGSGGAGRDGSAASQLCARLAPRERARREERFAFALDGGVLVVGVIDVMVGAGRAGAGRRLQERPARGARPGGDHRRAATRPSG